MALAMFLFVAVDSQAKYLTQSFHPFQIVWFRQLGLLSVSIILILFKGVSILRTERLDFQIKVFEYYFASAFNLSLAYLKL